MDDTMVVTGSLRLTGSLVTTGSATFKVNADRNLAIKYDTNVAISAQNDAGNPESVRYYADTFRIYTATTAVGLTERLTITNTGAVGIGVTNPTTYAGGLAVSGSVANSIARVAVSILGPVNGLHIGDDLTDAVMGPLNSGTKTHILSRAGGVYTRALTVDSAGYVGINNSSPATRLHVVTTAGATKAYDDISKTNIMVFDNTSMAAGVGGSITFGGYKTSTTNGGNFVAIDGVKENGTAGNEAGTFRIWTANSSGVFTQRMRITSTGYLKATSTGTYNDLNAQNHEFVNGTEGNNSHFIGNTNTSFGGASLLRLNCSRVTTNGTYNLIAATNGNSSGEFLVRDSGNVQNTNNSYTGTSDIKLKQDIIDANSQWEDIKQMRIRKFRFKKQVEENENAPYLLGVIAQEIELISPNLVDETPDFDGTDEEVTTTTKSVKYSIIYMKAVKALQEAITRIEELEEKLERNNIQ
jgi:hypothetical protein